MRVFCIYCKSLNRSPRLLLVQLSQNPRLVIEAQLLFKARLVLVHPRYSKLMAGNMQPLFRSINSTQTFIKSTHKLSQLLKPGLYLRPDFYSRTGFY